MKEQNGTAQNRNVNIKIPYKKSVSKGDYTALGTERPTARPTESNPLKNQKVFKQNYFFFVFGIIQSANPFSVFKIEQISSRMLIYL